MRIALIGAGYVGLVSGACFADFGHSVACVDKGPEKVETLRRGEMPIYEPGLADLVASNARAGRLSFTAEVVMIAVGTPSRRGDGHADLSYVYGAAREIAAAIAGPTVAVTKSTVPVGTGDEVERIIREAGPDAELSMAFNQEFPCAGETIEDFNRPDRIVLDVEDARAHSVVQKQFRTLHLNNVPIVWNLAPHRLLRPTEIPFNNKIVDTCDRVGADVHEIAHGRGRDNGDHRKDVASFEALTNTPYA